MVELTAAMVKDLRERTGVGMMDCKAALKESGGDIEAAVDWLRAKGLAKAAKKSGRTAAEGLVAGRVNGLSATVIELNSETDFVARNDEFQALVGDVLGAALESGGTLDQVKAAPFPSGGTVDSAITEAVARIGENMTLRRVAHVSVNQGAIGLYVHNQVQPGMGRTAVLVGLESTSGKTEEMTELARSIAMHAAAMNPVALDVAHIPADDIEREKVILAEKARESGKPDHIIEKIVESGIKSYLKEVTLKDQLYVHDTSKTVAKVVEEAEGRLGAPASITGYVRFTLGEGVEREESDFAAEVAAAVKN